MPDGPGEARKLGNTPGAPVTETGRRLAPLRRSGRLDGPRFRARTVVSAVAPPLRPTNGKFALRRSGILGVQPQYLQPRLISSVRLKSGRADPRTDV